MNSLFPQTRSIYSLYIDDEKYNCLLDDEQLIILKTLLETASSACILNMNTSKDLYYEINRLTGWGSIKYHLSKTL